MMDESWVNDSHIVIDLPGHDGFSKSFLWFSAPAAEAEHANSGAAETC